MDFRGDSRGRFYPRTGGEESGLRAAFVFPIVIGEKVECVMEFFSTRVQDADESMLDVMADVGVQLGRVIERVYSQLAIKESNRRLNLLQRAAEIANEETSIDDVLQRALEETCQYTGWCIGHVYLVDNFGRLSTTKVWYPAESVEYKDFYQGAESIGSITEADLAMGVLKDKQPRWVSDLAKEATIPRAQQAAAIGMRSIIAFPVMTGDDVVAVQEFFSTETKEPDGGLLEIMANVGIQLGRVFERQRSFEKLRRSEAGSAIGTLATQIAHEIASPLNGIDTTVQLLDKLVKSGEMDPNEISSMTSNMAAEINRLKSLVDELRQLVQPREQNLEPTEITSVLHEIVQLENHLCGTRNIELTVANFLSPLVIQGDRARLKQAFLNICRNAIEAMPSGGKLAMNAFCEGGKVIVGISDTGPGVNTDIDIYGIFNTAKSEGTGLGLPITYQIISAHDDQIEYRNRPGGGAIFRVILPQKTDDEAGR